MKNIEKMSLIELNQRELLLTGSGYWRLLAAVIFWHWDNWDELSEAAKGEVSNKLY